MIPILEKIHSDGKTLGQAARELNLAIYHLSHFIHRRYHKVSRANRKRIRLFFIEQGWLPKPKPRPRCSCPHCGKVHVMSMPFRCKKEAA